MSNFVPAVNQDETNEHIYGILFIYDLKEHVIFYDTFRKLIIMRMKELSFPAKKVTF